MIDLIVWNGTKRRQQYVNPDAIRTLFDVGPDGWTGLPEVLRKHLQESDDQTVCVLWIDNDPNPMVAFHDAVQIAKAVNQAKCLTHSLNSGFDPIMVDK